jgi:hypothetical protein
MVKKRRSHDTVVFFGTALEFWLLKNGPEHETVGIFGTLHGQKTQKPRYCRLFWMAI